MRVMGIDMTPKEAAELLDLIENRAPKLRDAGVRGVVQLDGVRFSIGDIPNDEPGIDEEEDEGDPLDDPATFGLSKKQGIPGTRTKARGKAS